MSVTTQSNPTTIEAAAARVLSDRLARRGIDVNVVLETGDPDLGDEAFHIQDRDGTIVVSAATDRGVLFGAGRVWRDLQQAGSAWTIPGLPIDDEPKMAIRNIYFADHMGNWYSHAPETDVFEHLEDMALWGYNELMTCLEVRGQESFVDSVARLRRLEDHARTLGMRVGTVLQSNSSFMPPPEGMKATSGPIPGAHDICASQPGAVEFLVEDKRQFYALMKPYDVVTLWPYDGGGCHCDACKPWGRTYLELSQKIAEQAITDGAEVRASAWFFERYMPGEDDALWETFANKASWFTTVLIGGDEARRWIADGRVVPDPYRALLFPDIAMFDGAPWGGRGANAAPVKFKTELEQTRAIIDGAVVYSEGRYDDVNKVLWARLLWDHDLSVEQILTEYAQVFLEAAPGVPELLLQIEEGMARLPDTERWRRGIFHSEWDEAAAKVESSLSDATREDWRWQYIRAKTAIEAAYAAEQGGDQGARERLRAVYEDLRDRLNVYDPEKSLATWFWADVDEAFPPAPV